MYKKISLTLIQLLLLTNLLFGQKLKVGDRTTNFSFTDTNGKDYDYNDFQDKKVVITFFSSAACSISNFRMHELKDEYRQLVSDNFEVIAIFESTTETLKEYKTDAGFPFIIVADPELKLFEKFAVDQSLGKTLKTVFKKKSKKERRKGKKLYGGKKYKKDRTRNRIPAEFILKNGRVLEAHYGSFIGDYLPLYRLNQF